MRRSRWLLPLAAVGLSLAPTAAPSARAADPAPVAGAASPSGLRFVKHKLDGTFRSEGVAVADINGDGKKDVVAGMVWYAAPDWTMHPMVETAPAYDPKGYSNSFACFADDLDHDGDPDVLVVDFPGTPTWWFENPGQAALAAGDKPWVKHTVTPITNNESPQYVDLDGDGAREVLAAVAPAGENPDGPKRYLAFGRPGAAPANPFALARISADAAAGTNKYSHGLGAGDVNGDGRTDVLVGEGWYEAPADAYAVGPKAGEAGTGDAKPWTFHPADFGGKVADILVGDFDGDGDADVVSSSAHAFGIWHVEQTGPNTWVKHDVDDSFSQTHAAELADLNGDGRVDFVTGKRWWAHAKGDPGGDDPAVLHWFELTAQDGKASWVRHQVDVDSGVGTQFEIADLDGDGRLDIVISNKKGVFVFRNEPGGEAS